MTVYCGSFAAAELMKTVLTQFTEGHWASADQLCLLFLCVWQAKQSFMVQELESCCLFLVETRKQTLACASEWLVRRGHLSLEDKPYCKSDYKDVELDLSLNSSAE